MSFPAAAYMNQNARTEGEMKQALEDFLAACKQIPGAGVTKQSLTISAGSVTPAAGSSQVLEIDTEAAAATDDLANIVTTNLGVNSLVLVKIANAARVVVVKNSAGGTGQMSLRTGGDFTLGDTSHWILFFVNGTQLDEVARFPVADVTILSKSANYTVTTADRGKLIDGTSGTWTLTLPAAATAGKGFLLGVRNSGTGVITIDGNASETVDGVTTITLTGEQTCWLVCDGSNWKTLGRTVNQATFGVVGCDCKNNAGTPNTQFDLDADAIVLRSSVDGSVVRWNPGAAITNNVSTAGPTANGRDQAGAFTASTFVHFYWIWDGTTLATLSSATAPPTGPTLPTGYTHWAYAGGVYFNGSSQLLLVRIKGAMVLYEESQSALSGGSATVETAVSLTSLIPANALRVQLSVTYALTTNAGGSASSQAVLRVVSGTNYGRVNVQTQAASQVAYNDTCLTLPNISQNFYYINGTSEGSAANISTRATTVAVLGYTVPNGGE